jgi:hypothetical protein
MRILKPLGLFGVLLLAAAGIASASTVSYVVSGSFDSGAPETTLTAPDTPFQVTFTLPEDPVPFSYTSDFFEVDPTDAIYSLGGTVVPLSKADVVFWDTAISGLIDVELWHATDFVDLQFFGAQIFQGATSSPTLLLGTFPADGAGWVTDSLTGGEILSGQVQASATGTPEPVSALLVGCGVAGLLLLRRKLAA